MPRIPGCEKDALVIFCTIRDLPCWGVEEWAHWPLLHVGVR